MGCGQKAVANDEEDWYDFKKLTNLDVSWDCYSKEATYAKTGYIRQGLKGKLLIQFVDILIARDELNLAEQAEQKERELYEKLKAKYG